MRVGEEMLARPARQPLSRTYSVPVHAELGCKRVAVEVAVPDLPDVGSHIHFAEHVQRSGRPTREVIGCGRGGVAVSTDLGDTWDWVPLPELDDLALQNVFTTASGMHLLQGERVPDAETGSAPGGVTVALLDGGWRLVDRQEPGESCWHGTRSIDEADDVIVYAEYPGNNGIYAAHPEGKDPTPDQSTRFRDSRLLRSSDEGRSWEVVLHVDWQTIRHFHTVVADPWRSGRWWASSGDRPKDTWVWESLDHGVSWHRISVDLPVDDLHPTQLPYASNVLRYTDIAVGETDLIWGVDDLLGGWHLFDEDVSVGRRAGARLFVSTKDQPWAPKSVGFVGNPVRSLIDIDLAYAVTTEAKGPLGYCPQVLLLWKTEPFYLMPFLTLDNFRTDSPATGFTYSRSSRTARDGVFFTHRAATDVFPTGHGMLRWRVAFD